MKRFLITALVVASFLAIGAGWRYVTLQAGKLGVTERMEVGSGLSAATADTNTTWLRGFYIDANDSLFFVVEKDSVLDTLSVLGVGR